MNGFTKPGGQADWEHQKASDTNAHIIQALEVIHNPRSLNSLRQDASKFLDGVKNNEEAPYNGFSLASNRNQPAIVRHYGLSLLENAIRHRWAQYTGEQGAALQNWVVNLAQEVTEEDPLYLRNKVAEIWVEIAKRSWALDWMDMDELLVRLWNGPVVRKALVLTVLETLSEDTFGREDATAGLRGTSLNRACVEIFTPASVLLEDFPDRETSINVRYGEEGWLSRIGDFLNWCIQDDQMAKVQQAYAITALSTLKSVMSWVIPGALMTSHTFDKICSCISVPAIPVQLVDDLVHYNFRAMIELMPDRLPSRS